MENTTVENTVETEEVIAPVVTVADDGILAAIDAAIAALDSAKELAIVLVDGTASTRAAYLKAAKDGRAELQKCIVFCKDLRPAFMQERDDKLNNIAGIKAAAKKEKLLAEQAKIAAELAAMEE